MKRIFALVILVNIVSVTNAQWVQTNGPLGGIVEAFAILPNATGGTNLFAGVIRGGVYLSTNNGANWTAVDSGLTNKIVQTLAVSGANLFAGTDGGGVFRSTNNGTIWTAVNTGLTNMNVTKLFVSGANFFAAIKNGGVFLSTNNGANWTKVDVGFSGNEKENIIGFAASGSNTYALSMEGVYLFNDNNNSWTEYAFYKNSNIVLLANSMTVIGSSIIVGDLNIIWRSTDFGNTWTNNIQLPTKSPIYSFLVDGTYIYAGTQNGGIFLSTDNGMSWTQMNSGFETRNSVLALAVSPNGSGGTNIFAGTWAGVFRSTDNGTNWTQCNNGIAGTEVLSIGITRNVQGDEKIYAGTYGGGVFLSTSNGIDYTQINNGFAFTNSPMLVYSLAVSDTAMFAGTSEPNVYRSTDGGTIWTKLTKPSYSGQLLSSSYPISSLLISGANLFAGQFGRNVYRSTDIGTSWTRILYYSTDKNYAGVVLAGSGTNVCVGTDSGRVYLYNGSSWINARIAGTNSAVLSLAISDTNIFAGTDSAGVFLSTNNGTSWNSVNNGLTNLSVSSLAVSGANLFAGTDGGGVFRSTNNGTIWTAVNNGLTNMNVWTLTVSKTNLYVGTGGSGVYKRPLADFISVSTPILTSPVNGAIGVSTNSTLNWNASSGAISYRLQLSTNSGFSPLLIDSSGITGTSYSVSGLAKNASYYWRVSAANAGGTSSYSSMSNFTTGTTSVDQVSSKVPTTYDLAQNFPNPFNPNTTIQFSLPKATHVSLKIYNNIGQEVALLVSQHLSAGIYTAELNAVSLPSGVYYYRLQAGSFTETKKLVLLR